MRKEQEVLNNLIKDLKDGNFKYRPVEEKIINWSAYNEAQINEINLFLKFICVAVDEVDKKVYSPKGTGRPPTPAFELAKVILMQLYFQVNERTASGLAELFKEKLGLTSVPSPRTIGRAYERRDVQHILKTLFEMTSEPIKELETSFSTDATGLSTSIKDNYANDREEVEKHKKYDKMAVIVSNHFHIATSAAFVDGVANESPMLEPMLLEMNERGFDVDMLCADAGFLSRDNCSAIASVGAAPYIYPKGRINLNQNGHPAWKKMLKELIKDPQDWLEKYHLRSNNEAYFSAFKRRFTKPLFKKRKKGRRVESLGRLIVQNICMLIKAYFEHDVEVRELRDGYF